VSNNCSFRTKIAATTALLGIKTSYWAVFCRFSKIIALSSYFLNRNAAKIGQCQVVSGLVRNKIRIAICQKQSHLSRFFWSLDYQHVQTLHLLQALLQSQSPSRPQCQHKNTKEYRQEPISVLGTPPMRTCGGAA